MAGQLSQLETAHSKKNAIMGVALCQAAVRCKWKGVFVESPWHELCLNLRKLPTFCDLKVEKEVWWLNYAAGSIIPPFS